jgi:hypothetical protein
MKTKGGCLPPKAKCQQRYEISLISSFWIMIAAYVICGNGRKDDRMSNPQFPLSTNHKRHFVKVCRNVLTVCSVAIAFVMITLLARQSLNT